MCEIENDIKEIRNINEDRVEKVIKNIETKEKGVSISKVAKEYEKINDFENKINKFPFYSKVIKYELDGMYKIILDAYKYNGSDQLKQIEATENILVRTCLEIRKVCNVIDMLVNNFYGRDGIGNIESIEEDKEDEKVEEKQPELSK